MPVLVPLTPSALGRLPSIRKTGIAPASQIVAFPTSNRDVQAAATGCARNPAATFSGIGVATPTIGVHFHHVGVQVPDDLPPPTSRRRPQGLIERTGARRAWAAVNPRALLGSRIAVVAATAGNHCFGDLFGLAEKLAPASVIP